MRKFVTTLTLVSMLLLVATAPAPATLGGSCCACVPGDNVKSVLNGEPPVNATSALFCFTDFNAAGTNQSERCDNLWGTIVCETHRDPVQCSELLAGEGIICPSSGAPAAGPWMLTGIVVALAAAGMLAARRRAA
jgi:hypothetical protein